MYKLLNIPLLTGYFRNKHHVSTNHIRPTLWKVILLLIFYNPLFTVISLFTVPAPLCKCQDFMLSDDNKQENKTKKQGESMQHFRHGQIHIWALGLTSHPFCLSKKSKHKKVKAERQWERVAINTPVKNNRGLKWCQKGKETNKQTTTMSPTEI